MPYVERRAKKIVGVYANRQPGYADELLADNDAEVAAYYAELNVVRSAALNLEEVYFALRDKLQGKPGADGALSALEAKFEAVKPAPPVDPQ